MFSKPVSREVTSKDVKYAIERAFTAERRQRLRPRLPRRPHRRAEGAGRVQGDPGHRDARRPDDRLQAHQGHRRGARRRAGDADLGPRAEGVRARSTTRRTRRRTARATRSTPARTWSSPTPRARRSATCPASASTSSATRSTRRWTTSGPRSWTRSTSRPATTTPRWRRGASSRARAWASARSSRRRASSSGCWRATRPSCRRCRAVAGA